MVAVSGGVDSGVCAALAVKGLGPEHVLCLRLPEKDVGDSSSDLGLELAEMLGARTEEFPITAALEGLGCYEARDEAIRAVFGEYEPSWRHKLVRSSPSGGMIVFSLVVQRPDGTEERRRMPPAAYRDLLAATNMKQRVRKLVEYTWADRLGYAVIGTPNLLEYDQGFFVKGGDGLADVKPIAGLYKSEVYALARELGLPEGIAGRSPTTETFSLPQTRRSSTSATRTSAWTRSCAATPKASTAAELAPEVGLSPDEVEAAYAEIERRREATRYLHAPAIVPEEVG